ncbi:hypothetical protein HYPSUDRAFT_199082 [Hypholoma sublateritium FD-334 SS-4]|uniref:F-box domain-containing protein n=1 Tax=Hypholoma sublateritium (strain FD-334 SS-4) TaxID=945553 RepID=A0A0D2LFE1_HYPSF|nr:hypothetical protein HYPSUDRAFT_199082 [Hypholoma sublateritium FD-334 SS-4]
MEGTILAPGASALSFVRLASYAIGDTHPPLHAITTLHLNGWARHYIMPDQLTRLLVSVPRLVNLSFDQFFINHPCDSTVPPQAVTLPYLRQLRLSGVLSSPTHLFALIDAPGLDEIWLSQIHYFELAPLPSVRHLTLDECLIDAADVARLARATPNVVALTAVTMASEISKGLLTEDPPAAAVGRPWPALRTLEMLGMDVMGASDLCYLAGMATEASFWLKERVEVQQSGSRERWPLGLGYHDPHYEAV